MFKRMKLASKLAIIITGVLTVILTVLLASSVLMSKTAIEKGISGELTAVANGNSEIIEQNFQGFEGMVTGIQNYIDWDYQDGTEVFGEDVLQENP